MSLTDVYLLLAVTVVLVFTVTDITRRSLERRRLVKRRAEAQAAMKAAAEKYLDSLSAHAGEIVRPEDIRYGDRVCWATTDRSQHEHYVAGFDGDPGPSTEGLHLRSSDLRREK